MSALLTEKPNFSSVTLVNCELCDFFASLRDKPANGLKDFEALIDSVTVRRS
jgi:hypothetical protein